RSIKPKRGHACNGKAGSIKHDFLKAGFLKEIPPLLPVANVSTWSRRQRGPIQASPVVLEARVVVGSGGGPDKTILNSPRFLPEYRTLCVYMHPPEDLGFEQIRRKALIWEAPLIAI